MNTPPDYIIEFRGQFDYRFYGKPKNIEVVPEELESFLTKTVVEAESRGANKAVDYILTNADIGSLTAEAHTYFLQVAESARNLKS